MRVGAQISAHEMLLRWARGELESGFFLTQFFDRDIVRGLLYSADAEKQDQGLNQLRFARGHILQRLPRDTEWRLAEIDFTPEEFASIRTINPDPDWRLLTGGSYQLVDACDRLHSGAAFDERIPAMLQRFEAVGEVAHEVRGITLVARSTASQSMVIEGHGRLVARYWATALRTSRASGPVTVALGVSPDMPEALG